MWSSILGFFTSKVGMIGSFNLTGGMLAGGLLIGVFFGWWLGRNLFNSKRPRITSGALLMAVKNTNELVSLRSYFRDITERTRDNSIAFKIPWLDWEVPIPGTWSKFLIIIEGEIVCRFDMSKAQITVMPERVQVKMPACELEYIVNALNENSIKVYDEQRGWFGDTLTPELCNQIVVTAVGAMKKDVNKVLQFRDLAKASARNSLENLISTFGYSAEISFSDEGVTPKIREVIRENAQALKDAAKEVLR